MHGFYSTFSIFEDWAVFVQLIRIRPKYQRSGTLTFTFHLQSISNFLETLLSEQTVLRSTDDRTLGLQETQLTGLVGVCTV